MRHSRWMTATVMLVVLGCGLNEKTHLDFSREQLTQLATTLGLTVDDLLTTSRNQLREELSAEFGAKVLRVIEDREETVDGAIGELRGVIAEIQPATHAAMEVVADVVADDPTDPTNWILGGTASALILGGGLLGLRGRAKRRRETTNAA